MTPRNRAFLDLHIAVFLFGLTAILGALISATPFTLVWWRVFLSSCILLAILYPKGTLKALSKSQVYKIMGIGIIVGVHWLCFYGSIRYANASVALVTYATTVLFTVFMEPMILRSKFSPFDLIIALIVVPSMILIATDLDVSMIFGFWLGMGSAFFAALFTILNKKYIKDVDAMTITFLEMFASFLFLSVILFFCRDMDFVGKIWLSNMDWMYMLTLVILCTIVAFVLSLGALKYISAFSYNLIMNIEPIYGIILAIWILQDHRKLNTAFYVGAAIIISTVLFYPYLKKKLTPHDQ